MIQGQHKKLDYRSKEIIALPEEKWTKVENTHEAIIDKVQFELVQSIEEKDTRISPGTTKVACFQVILNVETAEIRWYAAHPHIKERNTVIITVMAIKQTNMAAHLIT